MKFSMLAAVSAVLMLSACVTSVPMGNADVSSKAKIFAPPSEGKAGLYVYRSGILGGALKTIMRYSMHYQITWIFLQALIRGTT